MRFLIWAALFLVSPSVFAQNSDWKILLAAGAELRAQKSTEDYIENRTLMNFSIGGSRGDFVFFAEHAQFQEESGNSTLSVDFKYQNTLAWLLWQGPGFQYVIPYLGAGLGLSEETVVTNLSGDESKDSSDLKLIVGGAAGLRLRVPLVWLSFEVRVLGGEHIDPQPSLAGLLKMGVFF